MRAVLGFEPAYTTREAFETFVASRARRQPSRVPALGDSKHQLSQADVQRRIAPPP